MKCWMEGTFGRTMARPYASEMAKLTETFEWATETGIGELCQALRTAAFAPLRAIGSGGSVTTAHALAMLHQHFAKRIAAVATPLDAIGEPLDSSISHWLLSAGGKNVDVLAAARALIEREPSQLAVLCGRGDSPLAELCRAHPFTDLLVFEPPTGRDGFLATNSLLGFCTLLARAYTTEFDARDHWIEAGEIVSEKVRASSDEWAAWEALTTPLWVRPTTLVLYGPTTRIGAIDLESKFTEAALGNLQLADYRNFAHGRHHWLAKRGGASSVLAFITEGDRLLAERTLDLIPADVPQARLLFPGNAIATALLSLLAAFRIAGWVGMERGIDPGNPGVPDFGRKLYNLPFVRLTGKSPELASPRDGAAITRKAGVSLKRLAAAGDLDYWREALNQFRSKLYEVRFAACVFDYDGTLVDTRDRFRPPTSKLSAELIRLIEQGASTAVATGRGASVRRDLRSCFPRSLWQHVLVGYYNGAEIAWLDDDSVPDPRSILCEKLEVLAAALRSTPELARTAKQTDRRYQITLEATRVLPERRLWDLAHQVVLMTGTTGVCITRSSHSIDIVPEGVSKLNVVARVRDEIGPAPMLTIGDRGRWPGNDYALLREPFSLGVDEVSVDPETCWNIAEPGQRGPVATLAYLLALESAGGQLRFGGASLE
jgi:hypothetical protein